MQHWGLRLLHDVSLGVVGMEDKYPEHFKNKETKKDTPPTKENEVLDVEVIGTGYDSKEEQELAERKVRERLLYERLSKRKRRGEELTLDEDRALYNLTKVDFTNPADRDEIIVPVCEDDQLV
jgi:hypothetical protein